MRTYFLSATPGSPPVLKFIVVMEQQHYIEWWQSIGGENTVRELAFLHADPPLAWDGHTIHEAIILEVTSAKRDARYLLHVLLT